MICYSCVTLLQRRREIPHVQLKSVFRLISITAVLLWRRTVTAHALTRPLPPWATVPHHKPKLVQESLNYPHFMECEGVLSSHDSPPVVRNLSQINPLLILPFYSFQRCLSSIISFAPGPKDGLCPSGFHTRTVHEINSYLCYTTDPSQPPSFDKLSKHSLDRLCGLVVRVSGYRYRGPGLDPRCYQIFWVVVGLERGPLNLVRSIEELLEWKKQRLQV